MKLTTAGVKKLIKIKNGSNWIKNYIKLSHFLLFILFKITLKQQCMVRRRLERTIKGAINNKMTLKISKSPLHRFQPKIKQNKTKIMDNFFFFLNTIKNWIRLLSFSLKETSITNIFIATIHSDTLLC